MVTPAQITSYVKSQPFRPFRLHMASGQHFDIRHPEMIKLGRGFLLVFSFAAEEPELVERWETVSLLLIESISHLEAPVH
jgi:hypothetical protein